MTAMFTKIRLKLRLGNKEKINIKSQQNCFKTVLNGLILLSTSCFFLFLRHLSGLFHFSTKFQPCERFCMYFPAFLFWSVSFYFRQVSAAFRFQETGCQRPKNNTPRLVYRLYFCGFRGSFQKKQPSATEKRDIQISSRGKLHFSEIFF